MEDVLRLHARPHRASEPVVCLDERPVQLHDAFRPSVPMRPGRVGRSDYEYVRAGTANIFCIVEPKTGRRLTYASANRTAKAFAHAMYRIARRYKAARKIHVIVDNLNTHRRQSLLDAFGAVDGLALWKRFKMHYTPKHASWLNPAEIEASRVSRECLGRRRIGHLHTLKFEVAAWRARADREARPIRWTFTVKDARRVFRYDGIITDGPRSPRGTNHRSRRQPVR